MGGTSLRAIALFAALLFAVSPVQAALISLTASLSGASENPPTPSTATGSASITYDDSDNVLTWDIEFSGLVGGTVIGAHFHEAPAGINGLIVIDIGALGDLASPITGTADFDVRFGAAAESQEADLLAGRFYINIHTQFFPGGEIRGQVLQVPEPVSLALIGIGLAGLGFRRREPR